MSSPCENFPFRFRELKESIMVTASFVAPSYGFSDNAFGNLIDLARLQAGTANAEVCEVCNTINMGSTRLCKCCAHKLPAFYASARRPSLAARCGRLFTALHRSW
jgi:hypothetical protein